MGFFSNIADNVKRKAAEQQREIASASAMAAKMRTEELMYLITNNPKRLSILVLSAYSHELKSRMQKVRDSDLKMQFNEATRRNNMSAVILYGNELVERGYAEQDGAFYTKIGRW